LLFAEKRGNISMIFKNHVERTDMELTDHSLQSLVDADPLALARFVLSQYPDTRSLAASDSGLKLAARLESKSTWIDTRAEALLRMEKESGEPFLLYIAFESKDDSLIGERLLCSCTAAQEFYGPLPILPFMIYLVPNDKIEEPPLIWPGPGNTVGLRFHYTAIKWWEVPRADVMEMGRQALWPLATLAAE
jgi:hypothetical protein